MKFTVPALIATAVLSCASASSLCADSFDFSYTFTSAPFGVPLQLNGTFDGTANGNLITDISDAQVTVTGSPKLIMGAVPPGQVIVGGSVLELGPFSTEFDEVISFNGAQNNFYIGSAQSEIVGGQPVLEPTFDSYILSSAGSIAVGGVALSFLESDNTLNSSWSVTDLSTGTSSGVPDRGATIAMVALAVAGLEVFRRRFRASSV